MRPTLYGALVVALVWGSGAATAAPPKGPGARRNPPLQQRKTKPRPGLLQRIRRSRTATKPRVFRLLQLSLQPKKLFKQGKYVY